LFKNGRFAVPAQEKLSPTEQYLAYLTGLGIVITIVALFLIGLGTIENDDITTSLLIVGIVIIVLGVAGWLFLVRPWERFDDLKTPHYTGHEEHAAAAAPVAEAAPQAAQAEAPVAPPAPAATPDDLTLIEGIGPKVASALRAAGITTFAQIAAMTPEQLEQIVREQGVRLVGSTATWPEQARLAAAGDLTALQSQQARIKGGGTEVEDDLTLIEGIGPKSAAALREAGITTFAQVAAMTPEQLEQIVRERGVRLVGSTASWPEQARLAAAGDLSGLEALQAKLRGGN
jgi:predicted flap endonuclease-1-like 5' DNA nuclease